MKKIFLFSTLLILLFACSEQEESADNSIAGNLTNLNKGDHIYLDFITPQQIITKDTAIIDENGDYRFSYNATTLGYYRLRINNQNFINIVLNINETLIINGDGNNLMDTYTVEGSEESTRLKQFNTAYKANAIAQDSIGLAYQANPNDQKLFIQLQIAKFTATGKMNEVLTTLIDNKPNSLVSLAAVQQLNPKANADLFKKVDEALAKTMSNNPWFIDFHKKVESMVNLYKGEPAPDFTLNDTEGNPISLSSLKGKVVLIDFWASWCRPCRAENPTIVKIYNKYKNQGFDVMSVSLDLDINKWKAAIAKDNLSWKNHVSDLKRWGSSIVPLYGIESIPFTILIDREGIILGINLKGEELEKKIGEIL